MKELFETPEIEIIPLAVEDIIMESGQGGNSDWELGEDELPPF